MSASGLGRRLTAAAILLAAWTAHIGPAGAQQGLGPTDLAAIRQVVESQMAAFAGDDGEAAFAFASPDIRTFFGSADAFMDMVRGGYSAVYRPRRVVFQPVIERGGRTAQPVMVVGPDGQPVIAMYSMERQPDGGWLIDGVVLLGVPNRAI